jgi:pimeloyl-ACP methyl ester carboxylesterase
MWEEQMAAIGRSHTTAAIDLPGFGGSDALPEAETTMAAYAESCEAVARHVNAEDPWIVAGLSMGGYVAFEMWRRRNINIKAMILADTRAMVDTPEQLAARMAMIEKAREGGADFVANAQLSKMVTANCGFDLRERVAHWMRHAPAEGLLGAMHAMVKRPDSVPTLATIDVPVLLLCGEEDPVSPPSEMAAIAGGLSDATFVKIPGAAHLSNIEQPALFNDALYKFLKVAPVEL